MIRLTLLAIALSIPAAQADSTVTAVQAELQAQQAAGLTRGTAIGIIDADGSANQLMVGDVKTENDLLEIGSISKSFAGISAAELSIEGKLDLEAPISNYVPELAGTFVVPFNMIIYISVFS